MAADKTDLADLRRDIDRIDNALHDLLMERIALSGRVAASKSTGKAKASDGIALRPAREARIMRRLVERHSGPFPKAIVVRIWREIISANTALQGPFAVAVLGSRDDDGLAQVAHEHFGQLTPIQSFETPQSVLRAVTDRKATLGMLPLPSAEAAPGWWRLIARSGEETPRIVARLPFAQLVPPQAEGLAVSLAPNEATGHDRSYLVLDTEGEVSRSTLTKRLAGAGLTAVEIHSTDHDGQRQHLVEVEGFHEAGSAALDRLAESEGVSQVQPIGTYAVPLLAADLAVTAEKAAPRAAPKTTTRAAEKSKS